MTELVRMKCDEKIESILEILDRDGCIVIENVLDVEKIRQLKSELDPHFLATPNCQGNFYGFVTKRLSSLIAKSESCQGMAIHDSILKIMDRFLLTNSKQYQINLTQGICIGPGEPQQIIHRDDLMYPFAHTGNEWMINVMWAVDDFTLENGATHVVPGSHKWDSARHPQDHEIIQAEMKSGSALIYFASLLHGGGANKSQKSRTGIVISYCLGWLRQAENQYLAVPISIAQRLPERLQRLLGYFIHEPNLGCVEGRDPILLLQGENIVNSGFQEFLSKEDQQFLQEYRQGLRVAV